MAHGKVRYGLVIRPIPPVAGPPRLPQWNGRVERCNDTLRLEFRAL